MDVTKVYNGSQDEITEIFYNTNKNILVCAEYSNYPKWYISDYEIWNCIDEISIGQMIKDQIIPIYEEQVLILENESIKIMIKILNSLKNDKFIKKLLINFRHKFYNINFLKQLDRNPYMLCFGKDLYDLNTNTWKLTNSIDMCSFKCGVDKESINDNNLELLMKILFNIFKTNERLQYMIDTFSTYLCGINRNRKFYIWINMNPDDKCFLKKLFLQTFGDYCKELHQSLLTQNNLSLNIANDELYKVKGIRLGFFNEPDKNSRVSNGKLKSWIANEDTYCKQKYSSPIMFNVNMQFIILCNNKFLLEYNSDKSINMRTNFIDFKENEKLITNEYLNDEFLNSIKGSFMHLLIETYKKLQLNDFKYDIPQDIIGDENYFIN